MNQQQGFGNHHSSEAISGALPTLQNSPQQAPMGLYAEQISGTAFTSPRPHNLHSWLYRITPSVTQTDYAYYAPLIKPYAQPQSPNPLRWQPLPEPSQKQDFIDGLFHLAGSERLNTYLYHCQQSMNHRYFSSHDGELLFVPYLGKVKLMTEMGTLYLAPGMIAVIPRGIRFKMILLESSTAGYLCENGGIPLTLPEHGLIGANSLANPRHFIYPHASYESLTNTSVNIVTKYQDHLWITQSTDSPLNVVAWHGNYAPYTYDLSLFNTINTVSFDHPDPSIFTVLTSPSNTPGVAHLDFVIFPPRWMVAEHTFRPPYFHRNVMNEWMGLIQGEYDAKKTGFVVGGVSIHNCMTPHGPDTAAFTEGSRAHLQPQRYDNTLAFMFEARNPWLVTQDAMAHKAREQNYSQCWQGFERLFLTKSIK